MIQVTTRRVQRGPQKTLPPNVFRTVPGLGLARGRPKPTVNTCLGSYQLRRVEGRGAMRQFAPSRVPRCR
jgi:hypothetical protein